MYLTPSVTLSRGQLKRVEFKAKPSLLGEKAASTWMHLATFKSFKGHPAGEFEFTDEVFGQIIRNFRKQQNPVPLTFEHPDKMTGQPIPAAGWLRDLAVRPDGLWGLAEFTSRTAEMIRAGELKFSSVVVVFDSIDRETAEPVGSELLEVGITNTPFVDAQQPLALNRGKQAVKVSLAMNPEEALSAVAESLGLESGASLSDMSAALEAMQLLKDAQAGEGAKEEKMKEPEAPAPEASVEPVLEASDAPAEKVEATQAEVVQLQDEGGPTVEPDLPVGPRDEIVALLEDELDIDAPALLALLQERRDELKGLLADGMADVPNPDAPDIAASKLDDVKAVAASRLAASEKRSRQLSKRLDEAETRIKGMLAVNYERRIDDAIRDGHILSQDRDRMVQLSTKAPELLDEWLKDADREPEVPTGIKVADKKSRGTSPYFELSKDDPQYKAYDTQLRTVIADPQKRHIKVLEYAEDYNKRNSGRA